jgi:hypothetical protein
MKLLVAMLEQCAPGFTIEAKEHRQWLRYGNRPAYRGLPLGPHGVRDNIEVRRSTVRQLVDYFELDPDCVIRHVPAMTGKLRQH